MSMESEPSSKPPNINQRKSIVQRLSDFRGSLVSRDMNTEEEVINRKKQDMSCSIASVAIYIVAFGLSFWSVIDYFFLLPLEMLRTWVYINFALYFIELLLLLGMRS